MGGTVIGGVSGHGLTAGGPYSPRWRTLVSRQLGVVLGLGLVIRLVLLPITYGQDFVVWDLASSATLHGIDIYAHHPHYPGGPYAYFPLFLDVELPFRWLATHAGVSFVVLGKIPVVIGDLAVALLLDRMCRSAGMSTRRAAITSAAFFLNPLVLYNGAFYGRFDCIAAALLLAAVQASRERRASAAWWFAGAVAAKTFPILCLPGLLRAESGRRRRALGVLVGVLVVISVPYVGSWGAMLHDIGHDLDKHASALSWQSMLVGSVGGHALRAVDFGLLAVLAVGCLGLVVIEDLASYVLAVLLLFVLCSKMVLDQYLTWLIPFAAPAMNRRDAVRVAAAALLVVISAVGMLANAHIHPWGRSPRPLVVVLAVTAAATLACLLHSARRPVQRRGPVAVEVHAGG